MKFLCRFIANFTFVEFYVLGTETLNDVCSPEFIVSFEAKNSGIMSSVIMPFLTS